VLDTVTAVTYAKLHNLDMRHVDWAPIQFAGHSFLLGGMTRH
jgi:hypothetical protein